MSHYYILAGMQNFFLLPLSVSFFVHSFAVAPSFFSSYFALFSLPIPRTFASQASFFLSSFSSSSHLLPFGFLRSLALFLSRPFLLFLFLSFVFCLLSSSFFPFSLYHLYLLLYFSLCKSFTYTFHLPLPHPTFFLFLLFLFLFVLFLCLLPPPSSSFALLLLLLHLSLLFILRLSYNKSCTTLLIFVMASYALFEHRVRRPLSVSSDTLSTPVASAAVASLLETAVRSDENFSLSILAAGRATELSSTGTSSDDSTTKAGKSPEMNAAACTAAVLEGTSREPATDTRTAVDATVVDATRTQQGHSEPVEADGFRTTTETNSNTPDDRTQGVSTVEVAAVEPAADTRSATERIDTPLDSSDSQGERVHEVRRMLVARLSRGTVYPGSGNIAQLPPNAQGHADIVTCVYYNLLRAQQPNHSSGDSSEAALEAESNSEDTAPEAASADVACVREFVVCFFLDCTLGDADLDLFRPELDRYCATAVVPYLAPLFRRESTAVPGALPTALLHALAGWLRPCVDYLPAVIETTRSILPNLLHAALLGHTVTVADGLGQSPGDSSEDNARSTLAHDWTQLAHMLSLSRLLQINVAAGGAGESRSRSSSTAAASNASSAGTLRIVQATDGALALEPYVTQWVDH